MSGGEDEGATRGVATGIDWHKPRGPNRSNLENLPAARPVLLAWFMRPHWLPLLALLSLAACSGSSTTAGGNGTAPCAQDSDCASSQLCAFKATDGCSAQGHCFDRPDSGFECNAFSPACACDGTVVSLVCTPYPDGYAGKPILHTGMCEGFDGGPPDGSSDGGACGSSTCTPGQVCVVNTTTGGACFAPDDAGACAPGQQKIGSCCTNVSTVATCAALPPSCGGVPSCACASSLCSCTCQGATGNEIDCACAAP